jgi:FAD synthase
LLRKIRSERKFDTLAELQAQIAADRITIAHLAQH